MIPTTNPNPGDYYYVKSSPGELGIDGYIVYGTGTNNNGVVTNGAGTLIDNALSQPTGAGGHPPFVVGASTETAPTFTGDSGTTWDGTVSAIRSELASGSSPSGQYVIYFNLNETGGDGLDGIDLLAWFHVSLIDLQDPSRTKDYYLTGASAGPGYTDAPSTAAGAGGIGSNETDYDTEWVKVHGTICVSSTAGFLGFGPCSVAQKAAGGVDVNQNLGANTAAFAIYNSELSNLILDPNSGYDIIRGNWQFARINNGYEQEFTALTPFLSPQCPPTTPGCVPPSDAPEPGMLPLFGLGLLMLGLVGSRRRRAQSTK